PMWRGSPVVRPHLLPGYRPALPVPPRWRGYSLYPRYRSWYGLGIGYWGFPFLFPGYATWVWGWSPAYYPASEPPPEVVSAALPEGVLEPGGHVDGYLYFQRPHEGVQHLTLTWETHDARTGQPLGEAQVQLDLR